MCGFCLLTSDGVEPEAVEAREALLRDLEGRHADIVDRCLEQRDWWLQQWSEGIQYLTCLLAQDVQEAVNELDSIVAYLACLRAGFPVILVAEGQGASSTIVRTYEPNVVFRRDAGEFRASLASSKPAAMHPELAVLLSYAKMTLYEDVLRTELPDRAYLTADLLKYFPRPLRRRYAGVIENHRLRREITATWIANSVVNRGLAVFVSELQGETGAALDEVLLAYATVRDSFGLLRAWAAIENLPASVAGALQTRLFVAVRDVAVRGTRWFIAQGGRPFRMRDTVARFRPAIETVMGGMASVIGDRHASEIEGFRAEIEGALPFGGTEIGDDDRRRATGFGRLHRE